MCCIWVTYPNADQLNDWLIMTCYRVWILAISHKTLHGFTLDFSLASRWGLKELDGESTRDAVSADGVNCGRKPVTVLMAEFTRSSGTWRFLKSIMAWMIVILVISWKEEMLIWLVWSTLFESMVSKMWAPLAACRGPAVKCAIGFEHKTKKYSNPRSKYLYIGNICEILLYSW